jgi:hypothetical protein
VSYRVVAYRSATCCRVWDVKELRDEPIVYGPYKREKFAKKVATKLRQSRVRTIERDDSTKDWGPSYASVKVEPTP